MFRKIIILGLVLLVLVLLPFVFIGASIYFAMFPKKIKEWNKEAAEIKDLDNFLKAKTENNNNTGIH